MRLGVVFPQTEIGSDPSVIRDYAQAAESAGYDHLLVFDHVLGGKLERFDKLGRRPPYTDESPFHEVFVLFGYLGACTQRLELVTGIVILPQRQTALVAKQAAAVDVLTGGRLRLGVGIGWNHVEGPPRQRADRRHAEALDRARGEFQRLVSSPRPGRHQPSARPAPHPGVDGRHGRAGAQESGPDLRRLVPAVSARR
jgi:alkanesulfonate monooxygenase SsuD/methylene tetrahydromethanopterin reductase-like flavin-dependent oxidoreductase (luciferase family)